MQRVSREIIPNLAFFQNLSTVIENCFEDDDWSLYSDLKFVNTKPCWNLSSYLQWKEINSFRAFLCPTTKAAGMLIRSFLSKFSTALLSSIRENLGYDGGHKNISKVSAFQTVIVWTFPGQPTHCVPKRHVMVVTEVSSNTSHSKFDTSHVQSACYELSVSTVMPLLLRLAQVYNLLNTVNSKQDGVLCALQQYYWTFGNSCNGPITTNNL
jgi:hypothetical protein